MANTARSATATASLERQPMARAPDRERSSLGRVRAPPDLRIPAVAAEDSNSGRVGIFSTAAISPSKQLLGYPACCLYRASMRPFESPLPRPVPTGLAQESLAKQQIKTTACHPSRNRLAAHQRRVLLRNLQCGD